MMKKILMAFFVVFCTFQVSARPFRFNVKSSMFKMRAYVDGKQSYMIMKLSSDRFLLNPAPSINLKFENGQQLDLEGISAGNKNGTFLMGAGVLYGIMNTSQYALFPITEKQIRLFDERIQKIRINTLPKIREKKFMIPKRWKNLSEDFRYLSVEANNF